MATLLTLRNLSKTFGDTLLFSGATLEVGEHEKIGLVGVNGSGKSTLFRMIAGTETPDEGEIVRAKVLRIGYMEQFADYSEQQTVWQEALTVFSHFKEAEWEMEEVNLALNQASQNMTALLERQQALHQAYEAEGGLLYESRTRAMLLGLGFSESDFEKEMNKLSGGERTRVLLAKMLLSDANLILLDEPTNHLDMESVAWLERFLQSYPGSVIVISHDRYFLDQVTDRTVELEQKTLRGYRGNYSAFLEKKEKTQETAEKHYRNTMREIKRMEAMIAQQRKWNKERNIRTAEHKEKMLNRLKANLVVPDRAPEAISFSFPVSRRSGNEVLTVTDAKKSFGERTLFDRVNLNVYHGERIFLMGPNGCGKTTLLQLILGTLMPDEGRTELGTHVDFAYYAQHQEELDPAKTAESEVWDAYPRMTRTEVRNALAAFGFTGEDAEKTIRMLSGGERAKICLLKLMLSKANFLLLDEPTNHLDISSRIALEDALMDYEGTLFIVSHDRYFINRLADRIYVMENNTVNEYLGNYDYYSEKKKEVQLVKEEKKTTENDYQKQKERAATKRKMESRIGKSEATITELETAISDLEQKLADPEIAADYVRLSELSTELEEKKTLLSDEYEVWEALQKEWEEME